MRHVGFTGTRVGCTMRQLSSLVSVLTRETGDGDALHSGDCLGADKEAFLVMCGLGRKNILHPPMNAALRAFCHTLPEAEGCDVEVREERDYIRRNHDIVNESGLIIACPDGWKEHRRSGTWSTVRYATEIGKRLVVIFPDGIEYVTEARDVPYSVLRDGPRKKEKKAKAAKVEMPEFDFEVGE